MTNLSEAIALIEQGLALLKTPDAPPPPEEVWQQGKAGETFIYLRETPILPYVLRGLRLDTAYRVFDTARTVDLSGAVFEDIVAKNLTRDGLRVWKGDGITFRKIRLTHSDTPSTGTSLPEGIAIMEGVKNVLIDDYVGDGFLWSGTGYANGDILAAEGGTTGRIVSMIGRNSSDGIADLKGTWHIVYLYGYNGSRTVRAWEDTTAETIISDRPRGCHVWCGRTKQPDGTLKRSNVNIDTLVARGAGVPLVRAETTTFRVNTVYTDVPRDKAVVVDASGNDIRFNEYLPLEAMPLGLRELLPAL